MRVFMPQEWPNSDVRVKAAWTKLSDPAPPGHDGNHR
jgi:hypothetical protein